MRRNLFSAAVVLAAFFGSAALAQESVTITTDPNDLARPISTLLDQLRAREKVSVTYEDPRYSNSSDIEDVTAKIARTPAGVVKSPHRSIVPKGRAISFVYAPHDFHSAQGAETALARMLQEYQTLGGPTFSVVGDHTRLHVVPAYVLDAEGNRARQGSILDTVITISAGPRDGGQLLQAICDEIRKQTGYEVGIGTGVPENNLDQYHTTDGIDHMSARSALESVLDKSTPPGSFVWDLYYDPGDKSYGLNFSYVAASRPKSATK